MEIYIRNYICSWTRKMYSRTADLFFYFSCCAFSYFQVLYQLCITQEVS